MLVREADRIEMVDVEVDEDGIHLQIIGDFEDTVRAYVEALDNADNIGGMDFKIGHGEAEALIKMLRNATDH